MTYSKANKNVKISFISSENIQKEGAGGTDRSVSNNRFSYIAVFGKAQKLSTRFADKQTLWTCCERNV